LKFDNFDLVSTEDTNQTLCVTALLIYFLSMPFPLDFVGASSASTLASTVFLLGLWRRVYDKNKAAPKLPID